jgi:hypothetical protein
MEKKRVNNDHTAGGISPSSKSRSKGKPAAGARRRPSRLNDAAVRIPQWKRPNAQKHGAFSACPTIPGEEPREFQELHSALIDEWQPSGPSEEDAVFSLADLMWRKCRAQRFVQAKLRAATFDARTPAFDESRGLAIFAYVMSIAPELAFETCANKFLSAKMSDRLKQKFPRSSYQSTTDWAEAILTDIQSFLQPAAAREPGKKIDDLTMAIVKLMLEWSTVNTVHYAAEFLEDELKLRERLEAMIDRKIKHLIQLKAMKQMLRQTSAAREDKQPKRIAVRSGPQ